LWLALNIGIGKKEIWELVNAHNTIEETCRYVNNTESIKKKNVSIQQVKELLVDTLRKGIGVVCYSDNEYPESLREIPNPPCVLFYRGDLSLLSRDRLFTIVGTRKPSNYTLSVTKSICNDLIREGFTLVSGFAVGVDSEVAICGVNQRSPVVCVLASGIDVDYPKGNATLKRDVINCGGLVITEQPPDTMAHTSNFPKRNRILAGISKGTLVTEASINSGALITAQYTCQQGKPIFCVPPHDVFESRYKGVTKFIRDGAICTFSYRDVLYEYFGKYPTSVRYTNIIDIEGGEKVSESNIFNGEYIAIPTDKDSDSNSVKPKRKASKSKAKESVPSVGKVETVAKPPKVTTKTYDYPEGSDKMLAILSMQKGHHHLDDIEKDTGIRMDVLFDIFTDLELDGVVEMISGNSYKLI
jgi:DNA processing protein